MFCLFINKCKLRKTTLFEIFVLLVAKRLRLACFLAAALFSVRFRVGQVTHKSIKEILYITIVFLVINVEHIRLLVKINFRHSNPSLSCRIFLTLYRCPVTCNQLLSEFICNTMLNTARNVFISCEQSVRALSTFML